MKKIIITISILIILIGIYGFIINPYSFVSKEYAIYSDRITEEFNGFKIAHFSDLLFGSTKKIDDLKQITKKINEMEADIIVFTGDLFSDKYDISNEEKEKIKEQLSSLDCTLYKYAIIGDNDQKNISLYKEIMNDSGFQVLDNEAIYLFYKDIDPIEIIGLTNSSTDIKSIEETQKDNISPTYKIVLTHAPDNVDNFDLTNIDLILAGHSLHGQIRLPFIGGILKKNESYKYLDDYYEIGETKMYISNGLGTEKIKFRTFNKPSINKYRIYKNNEE